MSHRSYCLRPEPATAALHHVQIRAGAASEAAQRGEEKTVRRTTVFHCMRSGLVSTICWSQVAVCSPLSVPAREMIGWLPAAPSNETRIFAPRGSRVTRHDILGRLK